MPRAQPQAHPQALRERALEIYRQGLQRITPEALVRQAVALEGAALPGHVQLRLDFLDRQERLTLAPGARLGLLAVGKAAAPMAAELHRVLGARIRRGLVVTKHGFGLPGLPFPVRETGHPVPDEHGVRAAAEAEALVRGLEPQDVLLVAVSGGASALLPAPIAGVTLADKQRLVQLMLRTNMDIHEINRVRKAVSRLKGGGLAALADPRQSVGLLLSDVPGDEPGSIGSGLTVPEQTRFEAVIALLRAKGLWEQAPEAVRRALESGAQVPKQPLRPPINGLIGSNRHLLRAMEQAALAAGFLTRVVEAPLTGLNAQALPVLQARWQAWRREAAANVTANDAANDGARPLALICGGETTVEVKGRGLGGRCQELAALMLPRMEPGTVFLAAGSDGNDGPTDAAGGIVDRASWLAAQAAGVPYQALLDDNDSYHLLQRTGNLIQVPPTRNNVMDVYLFLGLR